MRVLEIGTGTGYTAALLAHYLGAGNVTTIEVDPVLAARARTALTTAGYGKVTVITGEGACGHPATPEVSDTDIHASEVCNDDAPFAIALQVPDCHREYVPATGEDDRWCGWFLDEATRSWARFDYQPGAQRWPVYQFGPRRLWDEVTTAYRQWERAGEPLATDWRFTITADHQHVELPARGTPHEQTREARP